MSLKDADVQAIEQYLRGALSPAERQAFEARLAADEDLKGEVTAYRHLFDGFDVLRNEAFRQQLQQWENGVDLEEEELLEQYWLGVLPATQRAAIEARLADDPAFAERARRQQTVLEGLDALRADTFAAKIKEWETQTEDKPKIRRLQPVWRLAVAASFLLVLGLGLRWYASANYGDQALLTNYYRTPATVTNTMGAPETGEDRLTSAFNRAHRLMSEQQYDRAVTAFDTVRVQAATAKVDDFTREYLLDNAAFSRALALIGADADETAIRTALEEVINDANSDYREEAERLLEQLDSFWRKVLF